MGAEIALVTLRSYITLPTLLPFRPLRTHGKWSLEPLETLNPDIALRPRCSFDSLEPDITLIALRTLEALKSAISLIALRSYVALRTLVTLRSDVSL